MHRFQDHAHLSLRWEWIADSGTHAWTVISTWTHWYSEDRPRRHLAIAAHDNFVRNNQPMWFDLRVALQLILQRVIWARTRRNCLFVENERAWAWFKILLHVAPRSLVLIEGQYFCRGIECWSCPGRTIYSVLVRASATPCVVFRVTSVILPCIRVKLFDRPSAWRLT